MLKYIIACLLLMGNLFLSAQYRVTIRITQIPQRTEADPALFLAGSFNNWNPADPNAKFEKNSKGEYEMTLVAAVGDYEYKITRGSWQKVEAGRNGVNIENRVLRVGSDTTVEIFVKNWADHFAKNQAKPSTASKQVTVMAERFYIPQLDRYRRIWIYLPESYTSSRKKYPVLYLHDGQNVFEDSTSFSGEWGVDEAMDSLGPSFGEAIVVAIDNGGDKRINEYSPFDTPRFGKAEGDQYVDFLVKTLRPHINKHYRVKKCGKHQYVAGSSMGGLISMYAVLKYPKKFGGAGIFSPSFWIAPEMKNVVTQKGKKVKGKLYFYAGMQEGEEMVPDMLNIFEQMNKTSKAKMTSVIRTEGRHNEATWRKEFPLFYKWLRSK